MNFKPLFIFVLALFLLPAKPVYSADNRFMSESEASVFYKRLQSEMIKDENRLVELVKKPNLFVQTKIQIQMDTLKTKQILYKNFYDTPSVHNPDVRRKLEQIFKKEVIAERDLAELQSIVQKIKEEMKGNL